jgi:hypothetical protein
MTDYTSSAKDYSMAQTPAENPGVEGMQISPEYTEALTSAVIAEWDKRQAEMQKDEIDLDARITELKADLVAQKEKAKSDEPTNVRTIMEYVKYFLEHLEYLLFQQINPVAKAGYFGLLFDKAPTYAEIVSGSANLAPVIDMNRVSSPKNDDYD